MIDLKEAPAAISYARTLVDSLDVRLVIARDLMAQIEKLREESGDPLGDARTLARQAVWIIDARAPSRDDARDQLRKAGAMA